ncbi:unnamed protein product, partial [Staurois parvus]
SGNRQQPTTGQGPRGLNGTLAVEAGHSTAPTQLSRVIGFTGTQQVAMAQALRGTTGSYTLGMPSGHGWSVHTQRGGSEHGWSVHTSGTVQDTGGQCTQQEQFRTRVVSAHSGDSSGHGWSVRTTGTVQDTGGQCAQQEQFRTRVVSARNRNSSGHRWSVHPAGTIQDTGGQCAQQEQ